MNKLELKVTRTDYTPERTIGELDIDGKPFCFTLEDVVRPLGVKVKGQTAIPAGRYEVRDTFSPKYGRNIPQILDVPMFQGIRIHGGNDQDDTEGCLLLGMHRTRDRIDTCAPALHEVYRMIRDVQAAGGKIWITLEDTKEITT